MIVFESFPSPERHIDRLYVIGRLFELRCEAPEKSRVLEIGCSNAGQLLANAMTYPTASFFGIDTSQDALKAARERYEKLGWQNVTLLGCGFAEYEEKEPFDYIICHGLFSWIPKSESEKLLEKISKLLKPEGIAYLSFNVEAGWATRRRVRDWLLQELEEQEIRRDDFSSLRRVLEAQMSKLASKADEEFQSEREEIQNCLKQSDGFLYHELLSDDAYALSVRAFNEMASDCSLKVLADAQPKRMPCFDPAASEYDGLAHGERLKLLDDIDRQTKLSFRGMLLSGKNARPSSFAQNHVLDSLFVSSPVIPFENMPDIKGDLPEVFCGPSGEKEKLISPFLKAALVYLRGTWPEPVPFEECFVSACSLSSLSETEERRKELRLFLLEMFFKNLVFISSSTLSIERNAGPKPLASRLARLQAGSQSWVTNLYSEYVITNPLEQFLLSRLDGDHSSDSLTEEVVRALQSGELSAQVEGEEVSDEAFREISAEGLRLALNHLRERALLVSQERSHEC